MKSYPLGTGLTECFPAEADTGIASSICTLCTPRCTSFVLVLDVDVLDSNRSICRYHHLDHYLTTLVAREISRKVRSVLFHCGSVQSLSMTPSNS